MNGVRRERYGLRQVDTFEKAAGLRDRILRLERTALGLPAGQGAPTGSKGVLGSGALAGAAAAGRLAGARRPQQRRRRR